MRPPKPPLTEAALCTEHKMFQSRTSAFVALPKFAGVLGLSRIQAKPIGLVCADDSLPKLQVAPQQLSSMQPLNAPILLPPVFAGPIAPQPMSLTQPLHVPSSPPPVPNAHAAGTGQLNAPVVAQIIDAPTKPVERPDHLARAAPCPHIYRSRFGDMSVSTRQPLVHHFFAQCGLAESTVLMDPALLVMKPRRPVALASACSTAPQAVCAAAENPAPPHLCEAAEVVSAAALELMRVEAARRIHASQHMHPRGSMRATPPLASAAVDEHACASEDSCAECDVWAPPWSSDEYAFLHFALESAQMAWESPSLHPALWDALHGLAVAAGAIHPSRCIADVRGAARRLQQRGMQLPSQLVSPASVMSSFERVDSVGMGAVAEGGDEESAGSNRKRRRASSSSLSPLSGTPDARFHAEVATDRKFTPTTRASRAAAAQSTGRWRTSLRRDVQQTAARSKRVRIDTPSPSSLIPAGGVLQGEGDGDTSAEVEDDDWKEHEGPRSDHEAASRLPRGAGECREGSDGDASMGLSESSQSAASVVSPCTDMHTRQLVQVTLVLPMLHSLPPGEVAAEADSAAAAAADSASPTPPLLVLLAAAELAAAWRRAARGGTAGSAIPAPSLTGVFASGSPGSVRVGCCGPVTLNADPAATAAVVAQLALARLLPGADPLSSLILWRWTRGGRRGTLTRVPTGERLSDALSEAAEEADGHDGEAPHVAVLCSLATSS